MSLVETAILVKGTSGKCSYRFWKTATYRRGVGWRMFLACARFWSADLTNLWKALRSIYTSGGTPFSGRMQLVSPGISNRQLISSFLCYSFPFCSPSLMCCPLGTMGYWNCSQKSEQICYGFEACISHRYCLLAEHTQVS